MSIGPPPPAIAPVDPYGVDIALDASGDLRVTASGSLGAVSGAYNCAQAVFLRFKTSPGEVALHPEYGSALAGSLIGSKLNVGGIAQQAGADLQTMLAEDQRFTTAAVGNIRKPASDAYPESVALAIKATLVGGEQLTLDNVSDPAPSDVSLPQIVDPSEDPTLEYDPTSEQEFFADQSEFDELQDVNALNNLVNDTPSGSVLRIG